MSTAEFWFANLDIAVINSRCLTRLVEHPWQQSTASLEPKLPAWDTLVSGNSKKELESPDATLVSLDAVVFMPPVPPAILSRLATSKIPSISASWRSLSFLPPID